MSTTIVSRRETRIDHTRGHLFRGATVADAITIPRHLGILRDGWDALASRLEQEIAPILPHTFVVPGPGEVNEMIAWGTGQLGRLKQWIEQLTAWVNGPLAVAIEDAATSDAVMRKVSGQFDGFADALIAWRQQIQRDALKPALRSVAPFFDAALLSLLEQLRDFARRVADALDPTALMTPEAGREGSAVALNFAFNVDIAAPLANLTAWIRHVHDSAYLDARLIELDEIWAADTSPSPVSNGLGLFGAIAKVMWFLFLLGVIAILLRSVFS